MPFGFKEVEGIHSRTDFDLSQHEKYSGRQIKYFDPERNENYTPYVVETSIGVDRMFLSIMCHSYTEEQLENGSSRIVLSLPEPLAPVKCAVLPLVNKDGLPEKAQEIVDDLKFHFNTTIEARIYWQALSSPKMPLVRLSALPLMATRLPITQLPCAIATL